MPQLQNLQKVEALQQARSRITSRLLQISRLRQVRSNLQDYSSNAVFTWNRVQASLQTALVMFMRILLRTYLSWPCGLCMTHICPSWLTSSSLSLCITKYLASHIPVLAMMPWTQHRNDFDMQCSLCRAGSCKSELTSSGR